MKSKYLLTYLLTYLVISPASAFANLYVKVGGAGQIFHGLQDEKIESKDKGETLERKYKNTNSALFAVNWGYKINESIAVELAGGTSFMPIEYSKNNSKPTVVGVPVVKDYSRMTIIEGSRRIMKSTFVTETVVTDNSDLKYSASSILAKLVFNCISSGNFSLNVNGGAGLSYIAASKNYSYSSKEINTETREYDSGDPKVTKSDGNSSAKSGTGVEKATSTLAWSFGFGANYKISDSLFAHAGYNFTHYGAHEYDTENILRAHVIGVGIGYNF